MAQRGFALIAALLVIWVLTSLGTLVFSVTTQDIRVSSRMVGERKAFAAAESGVQWFVRNSTPDILADPNNNPQTKTAGGVKVSDADQNTQYTITPHPSNARDRSGNLSWVPTMGPDAVPMPGYAMGGGETWGRFRYLAQVNGINTAYNSDVQIDVGVGYGPVDTSTIYR
jgi:Tfp pilus assembly protein PilX